MVTVITRSGKTAGIADDNIFIGDPGDALDLIAEASLNGCSSLIINKDNLNSDFFDLKTGFAGEILQKFSNYRMGLAIIGDFSEYKSKSLQDFIRESNRVKSIIFTTTTDMAIMQM